MVLLGDKKQHFLQAAKQNYGSWPKFPIPGKDSPIHVVTRLEKGREEKEQSRELCNCSLPSLSSLPALSLRKCKRVPELVCDKDHPPFQQQGGKDSAQVPHAEGGEQGLEIDVLQPGVKGPPQLDDLLGTERAQVSSCCSPTVCQARTQQVFSQLAALTDSW